MGGYTALDDGPKRQKPVGCCVCMAITCIFVLIISIVVVAVGPAFIRQQLNNMLPITSPKSVAFKAWQDSVVQGLDITRAFYFFNLTNPMDVYDYHAMPNYVPIGPFVFREHTYNPLRNISWRYDATIDFKYFTDLTFLPELSIDERSGAQLSLDTNITSLNIALFSAAYRLSAMPLTLMTRTHVPAKPLAGGILSGQVQEAFGPKGIFYVHSAKDFLLGYQDPLWVALREGTELLGVDYKLPTIFRSIFNHSQPAPTPYTGATGGMCPLWDDESICNGSGTRTNTVLSGGSWTLPSETEVDGTTSVGADESYGDVSKIGQFTKWAGQDKMWWWGDQNGGICQKFEGSNGMTFNPNLQKTDKPYIFFDALFRKVQLQYDSDTSVHNLNAYRFKMANSEQKAGSATACYGQRYDGVMNMTAPSFAPLFVTNPFFTNVDPSTPNLDVTDRQLPLINITIEGLTLPAWMAAHDISEYDNTLDIEPNSGLLLEAHGRIQVNTFMDAIRVPDCPSLSPLPGMGPKDIVKNGKVIANHSHFPNTMVPFFYMDRHVKVPKHLADKIHTDLLLPMMAAKYGGWGLTGFSALIAIICIAITIYRKSVRPEEAYLTEAGLKSNVNYSADSA